MNDEERTRYVRQKLQEGLSLSDVQKLLMTEHHVSMTYLELRLLAADLDVDWKQQDAKTAPEKPRDLKDAPAAAAAAGGGTKVSISKLVRPGASISGDVEFASGAKAEWFVDAMGRLALNPAPGSAKPTERDIQEFQVELQRKLTGGTY